MEKRLKIVILLIIINFNPNLFSQNKLGIKKINKLNEYSYNNGTDDVYGALNLMKFVTDYKLFSILQQEFFFCISFYDTIEFEITAAVYNDELLSSLMQGSKSIGYIYYKDIFVLLVDKVGVLNDFFYKTEISVCDIYYKNNSIIWNTPDYPISKSSIKFYFDRKKTEDGELEFNCYARCINFYEYNLERYKRESICYYIKKGDSWQSLSKKLCCPIETLQRKYINIDEDNYEYEYILPKENTLIIIKYEYENKKILDIKRIQ